MTHLEERMTVYLGMDTEGEEEGGEEAREYFDQDEEESPMTRKKDRTSAPEMKNARKMIFLFR